MRSGLKLVELVRVDKGLVDQSVTTVTRERLLVLNALLSFLWYATTKLSTLFPVQDLRSCLHAEGLARSAYAFFPDPYSHKENGLCSAEAMHTDKGPGGDIWLVKWLADGWDVWRREANLIRIRVRWLS